MSDPQVPERDDQPADVNDVVGSANESLAEAEAAANAAIGDDAAAPAEASDAAGDAPAAEAPLAAEAAVDPDLAAFEAAEREHPGTFAAAPPAAPADAEPAFSQPLFSEPATEPAEAVASESVTVAETVTADGAAETVVVEETAAEGAAASDTVTEAYAAEAATAAYGTAAATQVLPSEPTVAPVSQAQQPIFVQAPEPPRPLGNRATAGLIGLVATVVFAVLFMGAKLGIGALEGTVTWENIAEAALTQLQTWGFWVPVVLFFVGFWLLGAIINRGRWAGWVIFGLIVGFFAYAGHIVGVLFEAPFWMKTATEGWRIVLGELFAPLAIAAFLFGREITIWFGAWVARAGARKDEINAAAQREYERTLEAGPSLSR